MKDDKPEQDVPLTTLSPSRVSTASKCGLAFQYQYVNKIAHPETGSALLFGNVIHDAVQEWYGLDENPQDHSKISLPELVKSHWPQKYPKEIWNPTRVAIATEAACQILEDELRKPPHGPKKQGFSGPRQSKMFLESPEAKAHNEAVDALVKACDKIKTIKFPKDENPLQGYKKSLIIADQMEKRWKHQPRPIAVERPFQLSFKGFEMRGRIDQFRMDVHPVTGELLAELLDIKTGRNLFTSMEAFMQLWIYDLARREMPDLPEPDYVTLYLARHDRPQRGKITTKHDKLGLRILNSVARDIVTANFEPHYGFWCQRCDFKDMCAKEINIWPTDSDGFTLTETT